MSEIYQSEGQSVGQGGSLDPTDDLVPDAATEAAPGPDGDVAEQGDDGGSAATDDPR